MKKWSKYNYLFFSHKHNEYLLYNSLSNSFINISNSNLYDAILRIKNCESDFDFSNNIELYTQLVKAKILTESDDLEFLKLKKEIIDVRYSNTFNLTILPTLNCNFKCPYCWEKSSAKQNMTAEIEDQIVLYIDNLRKNNNHIHLKICWMGGEPLLNFNAIRRITKSIVKYPISLQSSIVTNGYMLKKNIVEELTQLKINFIQITLDGLASEHNKTRFTQKGSDSFSQILNNIDFFFSKYANSKDIGLNIRVNLKNDINSIEKFIGIQQFLRSNYPFKNLFITPGFIDNFDNEGNLQSCSFDRNSVKKFYLELSQKEGMGHYSPYPENYHSECAVRSVNCFTIGPLGEIYLCWDNIGKESESIGKLANGIIKVEKIDKYTEFLWGADYLDNETCKNCILFPICNGGCPEKRIKNLYHDGHFDCCCLQKNNLEEILENHYTLRSCQK